MYIYKGGGGRLNIHLKDVSVLTIFHNKIEEEEGGIRFFSFFFVFCRFFKISLEITKFVFLNQNLHFDLNNKCQIAFLPPSSLKYH